MTFELKEGQVFLHKNWKATPENKQPTTKGSLLIDGVEYELALWASKSGKDGSFSGKIQKPRKQSEVEQPSKTEEDSIPF